MGHVRGNGAGARIGGRLRVKADLNAAHRKTRRTPPAIAVHITEHTGQPPVIIAALRDPRIPASGWGR